MRRDKWRRVGFRATAFLAVPVFLLAVVEGGLRCGGYGYPTSYFLRAEIGGKACWVENKAFGWRFFPRDASRSPTPTVMSRVKPPGTVRVFVFGESAALGDPRPAYGVGRYLETLLEGRYSGAEFEVVCVAVTAINSHAILPLAKECAGRDGDLWAIYMGNNEMVGPYGACTVFGPQVPPRWAIRSSLAVRSLRIGQLLADTLGRWTSPASRARGWAGMGFFQESAILPSDPRRGRAQAHFRRNVEEILEVGRRAGVGILVSTVACNLKDCAPFASMHRGGLATAELERWQRLWDEAIRRQADGQLEEALKLYREAEAIDDQYAELAFRMGQCLLRQERSAAAHAAFQRALDLDALPFRTGSELNAIIREVAAQYPETVVRLWDAERRLAARATDGIPGWELFFEHVHLHFEGNYLLARGMAEGLEPLLPERVRRLAQADWLDPAACDARLGLTDWNRAEVYRGTLDRLAEPPFVGQFNHAAQVEFLEKRLGELRAALAPAARAQARQVYLEALSRAPDDHRLHENYAEFAEATGDIQTAIEEWQKIQVLLPHHHAAFFYAGHLLARQRRYVEAEAALRHALRLRPDLAEAWIELGDIRAATDEPRTALEYYLDAQQQRPGNVQLYLRIAEVLARLDRRAEAMEQLETAIKLKRDYWEARYFLGVELAAGDQLEAAEREFAAVVQLRPDHALAHLNLAVALAKQGKLQEAAIEFRETLRLEPENEKARNYLEQLEAIRERSER